MKFEDWFDPTLPAHVVAYDHLSRTGFWPAGFIPNDVVLDSHWMVLMLSKIASAYVKLDPHWMVLMLSKIASAYVKLTLPDPLRTKEGITVRVGQVWRDLDKRMRGRKITIIAVENGMAIYKKPRTAAISISRMHRPYWELA
jgi:hypothetical protein